MANSTLQSLSEIFNNRFFRIPDYQRGYAWGNKQLNDFWRDIETLEIGRFHYTGVITVENVCREEAVNLWNDDLWLYDKGFKSYYIIDGQQRFLTSMILIKIILDIFDDNEEINYSKKVSLIERYFFQKSEKYESFIFGYTNDESSDIFFKSNILKKNIIHTPIEETLYSANMKNARDFFIKKVSEKTKEELQIITRKLTNYFRFNFYEIDDELDECVTFETMNNRGRSLSKLELLKDRLIYMSTLLKNIDKDDKKKLRKDINTVWKNVYTYLGKNTNNLLNDDKFLEKHWALYHETNKDVAKLSSLLDEYFTIDNLVIDSPKHKIGFDEIKNYIQSLSECVERWFYIYNPQFSTYNNEIKCWLERINRLDNTIFYPLIMAILTKESDEKKVIKVLKAIERFNFLVFKVTKRRASTGDTYFCKMAHNYYFDQDSNIDLIVKDINEFANSQNNKTGFDITYFIKEIEDSFEKNKDGFYGWNGIRYFLYEYEKYLASIARGQKKLRWEEIKTDSIEHILPQKPEEGSEWECMLKNFKLDKYKIYRITHSLGNLLLLSTPKNAELQRYDFNYKKRHQDKNGNFVGYEYGSYSEKEVADYEKWTPNEILERGLRLLNFMEERWKITIKNKIEVLGLEFLNI